MLSNAIEILHETKDAQSWTKRISESITFDVLIVYYMRNCLSVVILLFAILGAKNAQYERELAINNP